VASQVLSPTAVTLLSDGELDTLALGQGHPRLLRADDEDVVLAGSEGVVNGVLDVNDVETTIVALTVSDDTNTTHVATTSNHSNGASVEVDEVADLASGQIDLDGVVDLDGGIGVADGSRIVRNQEWDSALAKLHTLDLAELVLGLLSLDAVDGKAALGVVDEAEVLASLLNGDDIHESGRVGHVGTDLAVDLDEALHKDRLGLAVVERILETVADEDDQRQSITALVGTGGGLGGIDTRQFVEEPVRGGAQALLVLLTKNKMKCQ